MSDVILKIENISKQYRLGTVGTGTISDDLKRWWYSFRGKENPFLKIGDVNDRTQIGNSDYVWALKDINLELKRGDVLAIIGSNGAGKSTLLKILSKVTGPTTGNIKSRGRIASLLEVGTGFHPELTGRENIFLNGAILGMTKKEITSKLDEIIDFSGCEKYIDTPTKRYSSGMTVRLAFAVAAFLEPDILIIDEVLAVGDAEFQRKAIGKMQDISQGDGRTVLFVSHNMAAVKQLCKSGIVLENGTIAFKGTSDESVSYYLKKENEKVVDGGIYIPQSHLSNEVALKSVKLFNPQNEIASVFSSESSIKVEFLYAINTPISDLRINLKVIGKNEAVIFTTSSHDYDKTDKSSGNYLSTVFLPKNFFNQGEYSIMIVIGMPNIKVLVPPTKILNFNIEKLTRSGSKSKAIFPGVTAPILKWDVKNVS